MGNINLSKTNLSTIEAFEKGYRVIDNKVFYKNNQVKTAISNTGYYKFSIRLKSKERFVIHVHKLVAYEKFGLSAFEENIQIRHFDSNPLNNNKDNILLGSPIDNAMDKSPEVRMRAALIATSFVRKHNHEEIVNMHNEGLSYGKIMNKTGIKSKGTISFIIKQSMASKINQSENQ